MARVGDLAVWIETYFRYPGVFGVDAPRNRAVRGAPHGVYSGGCRAISAARAGIGCLDRLQWRRTHCADSSDTAPTGDPRRRVRLFRAGRPAHEGAARLGGGRDDWLHPRRAGLGTGRLSAPPTPVAQHDASNDQCPIARGATGRNHLSHDPLRPLAGLLHTSNVAGTCQRHCRSLAACVRSRILTVFAIRIARRVAPPVPVTVRVSGSRN